MFMQRTSSGTFLPHSHGHPSELGSFDQSVDPFLTDLTADLYINPTAEEQDRFTDITKSNDSPSANFDMPNEALYDTNIVDLWANITPFDQSVNEDVQPMSIPNVIANSGGDSPVVMSQSCPPINISTTNSTNMYNYPMQSSPLANATRVQPNNPVGPPMSDRKTRVTPPVREQGGVRALFSTVGPRASQMMDKPSLRRSSSAHGKLGIRKKAPVSPRIRKVTPPFMDPSKPPSDMKAAYRLNQQMASTTPDAFEQAHSAPSPISPTNMQFSDPFNGTPIPPVFNSFSGFEEPMDTPMDMGRRRSTSLPPQPPTGYSLSVPNNVTDMPASIYSAPTTPSKTNRVMPLQIPRSGKLLSQSSSLSAEQQQKLLDDQLMKIDFDDITVAELKDMLRERKKVTNGKKADLVQRLLDERRIVELRSQNNGYATQGHMSFSMPDTWIMPPSHFEHSFL